MDLRRVTRPGGVVAASIWPAGPSAITDLWADVLAAAALRMPPPDVLPPELDFARTAAGFRDLLTGAGLVSVLVQDVHWTLRTDPAQLWRGAAAGLAGIGRVVSAQPPQVRERMRAAYTEIVAERCVLGVLRLPTAALVATGRVPAR